MVAPVATVMVVTVEEDMEEAVVDMVTRTQASIPPPPLVCQVRVVPQVQDSQITGEAQ